MRMVQKTFRDGEKKTSNDIIKVAGNRKNYNQSVKPQTLPI